MAQPTKLRIKDATSGDEWQNEDHKPLGQDINLKVDGKSGDSSNQETSLLIRVFYQVEGVPFVEILYNDRASDGLDFETDPAKLKAFRPIHPGLHHFTVIAWDHKNKPGAHSDLKEKRLHVRAQVVP